MKEPTTLMGIRIRALREQRNWNQIELAETMKLAGASASRESIIAWEAGKAAPRAATLRILAEVLGTSMDFLNNTGGDTDTGDPIWDGTFQSLKDDEKSLLNLYGELGEDEKRFLRRVIDGLRRDWESNDA
jgi:transcriptional regulator with XRE-family HTH domain